MNEDTRAEILTDLDSATDHIESARAILLKNSLRAQRAGAPRDMIAALVTIRNSLRAASNSLGAVPVPNPSQEL